MSETGVAAYEETGLTVHKKPAIGASDPSHLHTGTMTGPQSHTTFALHEFPTVDTAKALM